LQTTQATPSHFKIDDKQKLIAALGACQLTQRTYGKQAKDLGKIAKVFIKVLEHYDPNLVICAIKKWICESAEFPTPADIEGILNPQPRYISCVYQRLSDKAKNNPAAMESVEWEYIRKFEEDAMKGI
jgi:hypothetical protein